MATKDARVATIFVSYDSLFTSPFFHYVYVGNRKKALFAATLRHVVESGPLQQKKQ